MTRPVYAIPPSFRKYNQDGFDDKLDLNSTADYLQYLENKGATRVLTTAGTSQFNLLSLDEIYSLNTCLVHNFSKEKILGLPALSLKHLIKEIHLLNGLNASNTKLLILFPERYYSDEQVVDFFKKVCEESNYPIYLHGNKLRKGNGGTYEYTNSLLKKLSKIELFKGIKEEYSSLDLSMKCITDLNLDIIVAGGSMKRFWTLFPFGATSFLTGVGNFNPTHSEEFYDSFVNNKISKCLDIIRKIEKPLFDTFMSIGWHASMRVALNKQGFILDDREPFIKLSKDDKNQVVQALNKIL